MFLEKLSEYAGQIEQLPPPMYQRTSIRYLVQIDRDGNFKSVIDSADGKGKATIAFDVPHCKRSSGIRPKLLVDNGEYALGIGREKSDPRRVQEQHQAFVTLVRECAVATSEPSVVAVAHFLELPNIIDSILQRKPDFDPSSNVAFLVDEVRPFEQRTVQEYWAKKASAAGETEQIMQCLVCGNLRPPVERLPIVIKGIPGGQSMGLTLISGNAPAFESYGLTASLIAPTCEMCGERFGNALNELLRNKSTSIVLPPLAYVFWVRRPPDTSYDDGINVPNLMEATPEVVKELYRSARRGNSTATLVDAPDFYAATLSASGARVVLRDWIETTVASAQQHLQRFFWLQRIQLPNREPEYFSLRFLISATMNQKSKEKPAPQVGKALMHVALHGGPLPRSLMYNAIQRIRATRKVQPEQVALIKMVLLSWQSTNDIDYEEDRTMAVQNEEETNVAYLCGRLLAQLDYIQYRALGKVNATIVDRFYGTASTAPAVVFPRLLKGAVPHLATIRPSIHKGSYAASLSYPDKELAHLVEKLPSSFPSVLCLEDQGRFALGFFFQRAQYLAYQPQNSNDHDETSQTLNTLSNDTETESERN